MIITQEKFSPPFIKKMLLLITMILLAIFGLSIANNSHFISANSTTVQSVPLINKGSNAADAVARGGADLENAINTAKNNVVSHSDYDDEDDTTKAGRNIMNTVIGGKNDTFQNGNLKVDSTARIQDVFKVEHRVGSDILNILLYFGHWVCLAMFVVGAIALLLNIFSQRNKWVGLTIIGIDAIVMFLLCNLGTIYTWYMNYTQAVIK